MSSKSEYIPGVCNIGPSEIKMRMNTGWFGLALTIALGLAFAILRAPFPWKLLLFIPAMISAIGFLQAKMHFCAAFGLLGVFNFGSKIGPRETVEQAEYRRQDQKKALLIIVYSLAIGIAVTIAGYFI